MIDFGIITPCSGLPVTLDSVRTELKLHSLDTSENGILTSKIEEASLQFERDSGYVCLDTEYFYTSEGIGNWIELPRFAITSVGEVTYHDGDAWIEDTDYLIVGNSVVLQYRQSTIYKVTFNAGNESADSIPADIKGAIRELAALKYRFRESHIDVALKELPNSYWHCVRSYRRSLGSI